MYPIVSEKNTQPNPKEFVQQMLSVEKGNELLEMRERLQKESDPADLGEDAKYTRREWNPCEKPSLSA